MPAHIVAAISDNSSETIYRLSGLSNRIGNSKLFIQGSAKILRRDEPDLDSVVWATLPDNDGSRIFITKIAYSFITDANSEKTIEYFMPDGAELEYEIPKKEKYGFLKKCFS